MKNTEKILIVEDDVSLIKALSDKLTLVGFSVFEAHDGKEGLEVALRVRPDLILLDIIMPVMDGMTMLKRLRKENEWGRRVPVIVLTNLTTDKDVQLQEFEAAQPACFLVKTDWRIDDVVAKIRERLDA